MQFLLLSRNVAYVLLGAMFVLAIAGTVRLVAVRRSHRPADRQRLGSVVVWWVIVALLLFAAVVGNLGAELTPTLGGVLVMGGVSLLGLREFIRVTDSRCRYDGVGWVGYAFLAVQYACITWADPPWLFLVTPLALPLLAAAWSIARGRTTGYLASVASLYWGTMLIVYCLSFAALLWRVPESANPQAGRAGWFVFLVLMTQANDIAQALWGRAVGRRKFTPAVSPGKTWEGFLLGAGTTLALSAPLAMLLTPLAESLTLPVAEGRFHIPPFARAVGAGLTIVLGGFIGDLNMSALKRDLGVKDTGNLLPSQGGVLDRVDSLTFTAPLFFCYVYAMYGIDSP